LCPQFAAAFHAAVFSFPFFSKIKILTEVALVNSALKFRGADGTEKSDKLERAT
jgi:hypothetical protein